MKILKSWLQDHIEEILPSDEIITEVLTLKSSEVEGVEKIDGDTVFDIKVLPDRAHYMLSHRGVAYDLCAILNLTLRKNNENIPKVENNLSIKIESELCRRYSAMYISNIENKPSPDWLRSRLEAIGARSINSIVDATNYAMFDTGQPLHAFDADKIVGNITVRLAKDGEIIETLSGQNIQLKKHQLIITDDQGPLALAGVKGGKRAEVTLDTKNIILESANFNPTSVRKTSFEVSIRNDSSKRFENEITPYLTIKGIRKFLDILEKISPTLAIEAFSDNFHKIPEKWTIDIKHEEIEKILNYKISENRVKEILGKLECNASKQYEVIPPFERLDLVIAEDIIDEIGRIEGLDKIKSIIPQVKTTNLFSQEFLLIEKIKDFFMSKGFSELQTRSFTNNGDIEVSYPMASDKGFLRTSLMPNITEALKLSERNAYLLGLEKIQIFEIGKTFPETGEQLDLCFNIQYIKKIKNKEQVIKEEINTLIKELENELGIKLNAESSYIKDLENLKTNLTINSIKIEEGSRIQFIPFSKEPFIVRDIALFVENSIDTHQVENTIKNIIQESAGKLVVKGPDLFDLFEKDNKKSLAFRIIFQAEDRTLTDVEVNNYMEKVYHIAKERGWQVR